MLFLLAAGGRAEQMRRPMPVSNSTSLSPMLTIGEFCSSTTLSGDRKLSLSIFLTSSSGTPTKVPLGGPSGKRAVGNHRHFGAAEIEPMPIGGLRSNLGGPRQRAAAKHGRCAQTGAERKQGPSRNIICHAFFLHCFLNGAFLNYASCRPGGLSFRLLSKQPQAAPALASWQADSGAQKTRGRSAEMCRLDYEARRIIFRFAWSRSCPDLRRDIRPAEPGDGADARRRGDVDLGEVAVDHVDADEQ